MMLQINTVMLGEIASPGVRHSGVQQNTSGLPNVSTTSMRGDMVWYGRGDGSFQAMDLLTGRFKQKLKTKGTSSTCMQTTSCTWPYVVPIGEDPAAHGHWCAFTDLYNTIPYHTIPCRVCLLFINTHVWSSIASGQPVMNTRLPLWAVLRVWTVRTGWGKYSEGATATFSPPGPVCLVTLSLSEAGPGRFGRQVSVTGIYHTMPYHTHFGPTFVANGAAQTL